MKTANRVAVAIALGFTLLAGCAGVVPSESSAQRAQGADDDDKAATSGGHEKAAAGSEAKGKRRSRRADRRRHRGREADKQVVCSSGRPVRTTFYWQGRRTANGERFNPDGMTAAHRTLPFGTRLTVMNPRTGKSVVVVINDRGPFTRGMQLDLSRGAARAIGLTSTGTVCISS